MKNIPPSLDSTSVASNTISTSRRSSLNRQVWLVAIVVIALVIGAGLGIFVGMYLPRIISHFTTVEKIWLIFAPLLSIFVVLLMHECGHLLGGRLVGSRFFLLIVGPFKIMRTRQGVRLGWNTNLGASGGLAVSLPSNNQRLSRKMLITTMFGPLMSLLFALLTAILAFLLRGYPIVADSLAITSVLPFFNFLVTAIPLGAGGGFMTDGKRTLMLFRGGSQAERWAAVTTLQLAWLAGQRPRDWDASLLQQATKLQDNSLDDITATMLAYYHELDMGNSIAAQHYLERMQAAYSTVPSLVRPTIALESAFFEAYYQHNAESASAWFAQGKGGIIDRTTRKRGEAAILLAEGKIQEARAQIDEGLAAVKDMMYAGTQSMEEALLREMLTSISGTKIVEHQV